jgi:hypothetical protein
VARGRSFRRNLSPDFCCRERDGFASRRQRLFAVPAAVNARQQAARLFAELADAPFVFARAEKRRSIHDLPSPRLD